jgi:hypothetical protein
VLGKTRPAALIRLALAPGADWVLQELVTTQLSESLLLPDLLPTLEPDERAAVFQFLLHVKATQLNEDWFEEDRDQLDQARQHFSSQGVKPEPLLSALGDAPDRFFPFSIAKRRNESLVVERKCNRCIG